MKSNKMSNVRLSDDERLITLTKAAYDKLVEENKTLSEWVNSRSIKIFQRLELKETLHRDYRGRGYAADNYHEDSSQFHPDIDRTFSIPNYSENEDQVLAKVRTVLQEAYDGYRHLDEMIRSKVDALNDAIRDKNKHCADRVVAANKEVESIRNKVPFFIRWFIKD